MRNIEEMVNDRPGGWRVEMTPWADNDSEAIVYERVHVDTEDDGAITLYRVGAPFEIASDATGRVDETGTVRMCTQLRQAGPLMFDSAPHVRFTATTPDGREWLVETGRSLTHTEEWDFLRSQEG